MGSLQASKWKRFQKRNESQLETLVLRVSVVKTLRPQQKTQPLLALAGSSLT